MSAAQKTTPRLPAVEARVRPPRTWPVKVCAVIGALMVAFMAWILLKWVTGPYFERVPAGPDEPPDLMKAIMIFWQIVSLPAALALIYYYVIRTWRQSRDLNVDALLVIGFMTLWFQDPLSNYFGVWFSHNTWMINYGSWAWEMPGWDAGGRPGAVVVQPVLFIIPLYIYVFVAPVLLGTWAMRRVEKRIPNASKRRLIATCYLTVFAFDAVIEALIWVPQGMFAYGGGHLNIFDDTYHQWPLTEGLTIAATMTCFCCIRYFRDDRGRTLAERGIDQLRAGRRTKLAMRVFAVIAAVNLSYLITYNVPNLFAGKYAADWPADINDRSYFTSGLCGTDDTIKCPPAR